MSTALVSKLKECYAPLSIFILQVEVFCAIIVKNRLALSARADPD